MLRKTLLLLILCVVLSACGFTPLYATKDSGLIPKEDLEVTGETAKIYVAPIANRLGQIMRQDLVAILSPRASKEKKYVLTVRYTETLVSEQGIREDDIPTRITLGYSANYVLMEKDKELIADVAYAQSSYNVLQSGYSTVTAKDAIRKQIVKQLARDIALQVTAYLKQQLMRGKINSLSVEQ